MKTTAMLCMLIVSMVTIATGTEVDPCLPGNHSSLADVEFRSTHYIMSSGETARCDRRLVAGWYRVLSRAGQDMPTWCPPETRCGTLYPIWLNGTIPPADGRVHDRLAALHADDDCFLTTYSIQVKNCGDFRVYRLHAVDACPAAFCFGEGSVCPPGQTSASGYTPCNNTDAQSTTEVDDLEVSNVITSTIATNEVSSRIPHGVTYMPFQNQFDGKLWYGLLAIAVISLLCVITRCVIVRFMVGPKQNRGSNYKVTPKEAPTAYYLTLPPPVSIYYGDLYLPPVETVDLTEKIAEKRAPCPKDQASGTDKVTYKC